MISAHGLNERLRQVYEPIVSDVARSLTGIDGFSGPHLIAVPECYPAARVRLIVIGQQTKGWDDYTVGVDGLWAVYRTFDLGRGYFRSPFWQAAHEIHRSLNPGGPDRCFLWSNLVKVDVNEKRPAFEVEEQLSSYRLLAHEIRITMPTVAIFFTGPHYDERLRAMFPDVEYQATNEFTYRLRHAELPGITYRTYHPNYLWRSGNRKVLHALVESVRSEAEHAPAAAAHKNARG